LCTQIGCNAVSWGPYLQPGSLVGHSQNPVKRFVSGGCDNLVKIWRWVMHTFCTGKLVNSTNIREIRNYR